MFKMGVSMCPASSKEQEESSRGLGCQDTTYYHCLKDQRGTLGEICVQPSWIPAGYCPEYNTIAARVDAEKCDKDLGICPAKTYLSNEVLSYSACLTTDQGSETNGTVTPPVTVTGTPDVESPSVLETSTIVLIGIGISVLLVLLLIIICVLCLRKRRGNDNRMLDESMHLNDSQLEPTESQDVDMELDRTRYDVFYETRAYNKLKSLLDAGESALILGHPGMGKTATCVRLFDYFQRRKGLSCAMMKDFVNISHLNQKSHNIIFLDDCFESWKNKNDNGQHYPEIVEKITDQCKRSSKLRVVITLNSVTLKVHQEIFEKLSFYKNRIDLSADDFVLESDEKKGILTEQLRRHKINIMNLQENENEAFAEYSQNQPAISMKSIDEIVTVSDRNADYKFGFPLACVLFCCSKNLLKLKSSFFNEPLLKVRKDLQKLRQSSDPTDMLSCLIYAYIVLKGEFRPSSLDNIVVGKLSNYILPKLTQHAKFGMELPKLGTEQWKEACKKSCYVIEKHDGQYKFLHECVLKAALLDISLWQKDLFMKLCDDGETIRKLLQIENETQYPVSMHHSSVLGASVDTFDIAKHLRSDQHMQSSSKHRETDIGVVEEDAIQPLVKGTHDFHNEVE